MKTKVISLSSGKGGVGKTSLVANLGYTFASLGKNVLLIDGDWTLGKLGIALGVRPHWTVEEVLRQKILLREAVEPVAENLSLLASPSGSIGFDELDYVARRQLFFEIESFRDQFDIILIDHGSGIHASILEFAAASHHQLVVTTPEPTSYTDAYAIMKLLSKRYAIREFGLVVTNAPSDLETQSIVARFCDVARGHLDIRVTLLQTFPWEQNLAEALRKQKAFVELWPNVAFSRRLAQLTETIDRLSYTPRSGLQFFQNEESFSYERDAACRV